jgi:uncharacterized protein (TIGR00730 family)
VGELSSVCVYLGSRHGDDPAHAATARAVGRRLAGAGLTIVYGGGAVGLMGELADAALGCGGTVVGVIPRGLFRQEVAHRGLTDLIEVASMHQRKQVMFEASDAFVALPGGLGTLEELAEMATWSQLGLHRKPIATLGGTYWRPLHAWVAQAVASGFLDASFASLVLDVGEVEDLLPALRSYLAPRPPGGLSLGET